MLTINNNSTPSRVNNVNFTATKTVKPKSVLPKEVIDRFDLNMKSRVGYSGEPSFKDAPDTVELGLRAYLRRMKINWETHVNPNEHRKSYE